jgi:hypothetical protein
LKEQKAGLTASTSTKPDFDETSEEIISLFEGEEE